MLKPAAVFFVYILYSESADKYYIGSTDDVSRRLEEHNSVDKNTYTSRYRPWVLKASFMISECRGDARRVESYLKRLKSRKIIERIIENPGEFGSILDNGQSGPDLSGLIRRS